MRILLLTQIFDPEPTFKGMVFAKALQDAGHEIEIITGFPNYPGGKIYTGYKLKWRQKEDVSGIKITRVFLFPSHSRSLIKRIINYSTFAISACLYGVFGAKKADVIYVFCTPITVGLAAVIIGFFQKIPFLLDIQDLWPDTLRATGMLNNKYLLKVVDIFCKLIYQRAKYIVVLSPGMRQLLIDRKVPGAKVGVVYNWANEKLIFSCIPVDFCQLNLLPGKFNVVFAGNMGKAQALDTILLVAKRIRGINSKIQFVLVGDGIEVERLKRIVLEQQIDNVRFISRMEMQRIGAVLQLANILLVHLKNDPLFEITIPSKTQAYMAFGKPILMAVKGDGADLIKLAKAGYCADPENVDSIVNSILEMAELSGEVLNNMGLNGKEFYNKNLSLKIGVEKFLNIFDSMIH
ncbi:MAG: glycosyltransferase family 4 protein [Coxiellaceae bacterium]|jgi:glycosyltransferase involved in cell wall biosynthesis|nr:glycosyltransferase family 4 protein [Coxiellaceae bacterium]